MGTVRKLTLWNQIRLEQKNAVVATALTGYKSIGCSFTQSDLSTSLLAHGFFITSCQCKELIDSLVNERKVVCTPEGMWSVL
jgi:hypothetical protein